MPSNSLKKVALAVGFASSAASISGTIVKAGPALQTLNNATSTAEFTINNTYGQSFSVDGIVQANVTPFAAATGIRNFTAGSATLTTGFSGQLSNFIAPTTIEAQVAVPGISATTLLDAASLTAITLTGNTGTQTLGASISSTIFGPSTVKATSSFTNQLINDLSAF